MSRVAVLGAGHGGLAVAARLAVKGHAVTVYESSDEVVTLDQVLTLPAAYRDFFLKTGSALEDNLALVELNQAVQIPIKDADSLNIPGSGQGRTLTQIAQKLGDESANQWRKYLQHTGELWQDVRAPLVEAQLTQNLIQTVGFKNYLRFRKFSNYLTKNVKNSVLQELAQHYRSQCRVSAKTNLGLLSLNAYVQQIFGVYQPAEGLRELTQALKKRCIELGVDFKFETPATPVELGDKIIGVELEKNKFTSCDYVVVNDLSDVLLDLNWRSMPSYETKISSLYVINETSWLGLGPAHAVIGASIVAQLIGSAAD